MQCAGNRRAGLNRVKPAQGLAWDCGAIGTAVWTGVWLRDVLAAVGVDAAAAKRGGLKHVQFLPLDPPYDASIPMRQALDEDGDVLLAFEMNGEELTREHGYGHTTASIGRDIYDSSTAVGYTVYILSYGAREVSTISNELRILCRIPTSSS